MMEQKKRVLVVDDEPGVLRFASIALTSAGFDAATTASGAEALKLVAEQHFDLMLLGVFMEPVSGLDVLDKLGLNRTLPVIVFSAGVSIVDRVMQAGADAFIAKPFKPEELVAKIDLVLSRKQKS